MPRFSSNRKIIRHIILGTIIAGAILLFPTIPSRAFDPGEPMLPIIICKEADNLIDAIKLRAAGADLEGLEIVNALMEKNICVRNIFGLPMKTKAAIYIGNDLSVYQVVDPIDETVLYYTIAASPKGAHKI